MASVRLEVHARLDHELSGFVEELEHDLLSFHASSFCKCQHAAAVSIQDIMIVICQAV